MITAMRRRKSFWLRVGMDRPSLSAKVPRTHNGNGRSPDASTPVRLPALSDLSFRELDDFGRERLTLEAIDVLAPLVRERLVDVELLGHGQDEWAVVLFRQAAVKLIRV